MWRIAICYDNAAETIEIQTSSERYVKQKELSMQVSIYSDGRELISAHEDEGAILI